MADGRSRAGSRAARLFLAAVLVVALATTTPTSGLAVQTSAASHVDETVFDLGAGHSMRYAISVPLERDAKSPRPLVLALHPGGRDVYYGSWFMQTIVEPALRNWHAIIVAPDVPDENWTTELSEESVLALVDQVRTEYPIDEKRILVTGFSMGGRGAWHFVSRHADLFTGAIVVATGPGRGSLESLAETPLYIIHSTDDEVVEYGPTERLALDLADRGYPVQLMRLSGASHGMMGDYVAPLKAAGEWMLDRWRSEAAPRR